MFPVIDLEFLDYLFLLSGASGLGSVCLGGFYSVHYDLGKPCSDKDSQVEHRVLMFFCQTLFFFLNVDPHSWSEQRSMHLEHPSRRGTIVLRWRTPMPWLYHNGGYGATGGSCRGPTSES